MSEKLQIFGHRGAAGTAPENTLPSMQKALDAKVDGIEIDVHRCKSGELVVIHDSTVDRTTNGEGKVAKLSLLALKKLVVAESGQIPTLLEVLEMINGQCILNIELKGKKTAKATMALLEETLKKSKWVQEQFIISSFDWKQLKKIKKINSTIRIGVLTEGKPKKAFKMARKLNAFSIHPDYAFLKKNHIWQAKRRSLAVYPWTVNKPKAFEKMKGLEVAGIITDFPERYVGI